MPDTIKPTSSTTTTIDKSNWEWVEVPERDLFDVPHTGVNLNLEHYGPGKHLLDPQRATTIKELLRRRLEGDMRILRPTPDKQAVAFQGKLAKEHTS